LDLPDALKLDGLSVDGKIQTGFNVSGATHNTSFDNTANGGKAVDSGAENPVAQALSDDIGDGTAFRTDLNVVYQKENVGIRTRFRFQPERGDEYNFDSPFTTAAITINKGFIWANVLNKTVTVSAGRGLNEAWTLFYSDFGNRGGGTNSAFDGKDGLKVEVTPIEGLNVGAFYGMANLFRDAYEDGDNNGAVDDRRLVVGAKYDNPRFGVMFSVYHNFAETNYDNYTLRVMAQSDWTTGVNTAFEKGVERGRRETAKALKGMGVSVEMIAASTGLTLDAIAAL
jgi:hypothetical protein